MVDFRESLEFLYGLQTFGIKLGLANTVALLDRVGHPERSFAVVHVAGTNGKGSVCAMLAEILRRAGYRTGLYTSPHLHSFTERIRIDGTPLSEEEVVALTDEVRRAGEGIPATFFEFTTVLALTAFARRQVEIVILETGMGGRLDATNAVTPLLTVITPISLDHQEHLGATLAAIAAEKAAIIKPRVPVVVGRQPPEALTVILEQARRMDAFVSLFDRDFTVGETPVGWLVATTDGETSPAFRPGLAGRHQCDNAALAVQAVSRLRRAGFDIPPTALIGGIAGVVWPGRLEWRGGGAVLFDGAHNQAGAAVLADYLDTLDIDGVHWIAGFKADKAWRDMLPRILPHACHLYAVEPPGIAAVAAGEIAAAAVGCPSTVFATPGEALAAALAARGEREVVLIAGSLFLVGALRELVAEGGRG